jgi:hypothetical protein
LGERVIMNIIGRNPGACAPVAGRLTHDATESPAGRQSAQVRPRAGKPRKKA